MQSKLPAIPTDKPFKVSVESGKKYFWCSCGLAKTQPFCDGSHKGTGFKSIAYEAKEDGIISFCGCKQSKNNGLCDGAHKEIEQ